MKTINKFLFWLFAPLTLAACGVAGGPGEAPTEPDTTPPRITQALPAMGATVEPDQAHIEIVFSEAIDEATLAGALSVSVDSAPHPGNWDYDAATFTARFQPQQPFDFDQLITVTVTTAITDVAGNPLESSRSWSFRTPRLFTLEIRGNGLMPGVSLEISEDESGQNITLSGNNRTAFAQRLREGSRYRLRIGQSTLPADTPLTCALLSPEGEMNADVTVELYCTPVVPLYPTHGSGWNDYLANDGTDPFSATDQPCSGPDYRACLHGGELRRFPLPGVSSCDGLTIQDDLGAFRWSCRATADGGLEAVSLGLAADKGLRDLIDFDTFTWRLNQVRVLQNGSQIADSGLGIWWHTPVREAGETILGEDGVVYAVAATTPSRKFKLYNRVRTALAVAPDLELQGNGLDPVLDVSGSVFLWIEARVDAAGQAEYGVQIDRSRFVVLRHTTVRRATSHGLQVNNPRTAPTGSHYFYRLRSHHNGADGIRIKSDHTTLEAVETFANGDAGLTFATTAHNRLQGLRSAANGGHGLLLDRSDANRIEAVASYGNGGDGIRLIGTVDNVLQTILATGNDGDGLNLARYDGYGSTNNLLRQLTLALNGGSGIRFAEPNAIDPAGSNANRITALAAVANGGGDINGTLDNTFQDTRVGSCPSTSCPSGVSDGLAMEAFVGAIDRDDNRNASDVNGSAYANQLDDWTTFEHPYRTWGKDGSAAGNCLSLAVPCRIYDWSLRSTDTLLRDALTPPDGDATLTHSWYDNSQSTFLANALELAGDGDGLCQSGETCLFPRNIGAYPGHGALADLPFNDGAISGVTLRQHSENGR